MTTMTDYTGRTVDLFVAQGAAPAGDRPIGFGFGGSGGGQLTTGVQKAAQMFVMLLLTSRGSRLHDDNFGTDFLNTIAASNLLESRLTIAFREAVDDILRQQSRYLDSNAADDEVIVSADLITFDIPDQTSLRLVIRLDTRAGSSREMFVPINLVIR